ncbi:MAG: DUF362 domain-containing protein [bacterium]
MRERDKSARADITRREFLGGAGAAAIGLIGMSALGGGIFAESAKAAPQGGKGRSGGRGVVVIGRDPKIWDGAKLNKDKTRDLAFRAVRAFSGADSDVAAWSAFFGPDDRVSMKMNCIGGKKMSTTPAIVEAIAAGLMLAGVSAKNIVAWDRTEWEVRMAGFNTGRDKKGVLYTATDADGIGYDSELTSWGEASSLVSRIASSYSSAMVNVPILKDHDMTGISCAMKNWYGAVNNPNKLHENACDPYIADVNMMSVFREKTKLIVLDATTGQYNGGPGHKPKFTWPFAGLIVGTDPVAVDAVAYHIIDEKRKAEGLPTLKAQGRPPKFLNTAADAKHKLGENRYEKIRIIEV